jgi:hypothetical protein
MVLSICRLCALGALLLLTIGAAEAAAQDPDPDRAPIGWFAADARGVFAKYTGDDALPAFLDVTRENLARRGLGFTLGAHVYPVRFSRRVSLGVGAEVLFSRGSKTLKLESNGGEEEEVPDGPTVDARLSAFSPQVSLNFGGRDGWSYISGGIGWTEFSTEVKLETSGTPVTPGNDEKTPRTSTINYGGGARWYMKRHVAFSLDLRFYRVKASEATSKLPALAGTRLLMLSAGVSFK